MSLRAYIQRTWFYWLLAFVTVGFAAGAFMVR